MPQHAMTGHEALERLREGNQRFVSDVRSLDALLSHTRRAMLAASQSPFAIILGCSDSRVPAEIVFDQGLGDLFVIRVAGNIVQPSQIGSVEFAEARFGTPLVVVMGHTQCGAVVTALEKARHEDETDNVQSIVDLVRAAIDPLVASRPDLDEKSLMEEAVRANVRASARQLREAPMLQELILDGRLLVAGAMYHLETGAVEFFDVG